MKRLLNLRCVMFHLALLYALHFTHYAAFAQPIPSTELIDQAKQYDGKTVAYAGEVIGDIMARGDYAWVNIHDGKNAIGIWIKRDLAKEIIYTGSYKFKGDTIEISGVFHRACLQHGGDLDIHAENLVKILPGSPVPETPDLQKRNTVILLLGPLFLLWISTLLKRK